MIEVIVQRNAVNIRALDAQLWEALGSAFSGVSGGDGQITAHLSDRATPDQVTNARAIITAHDPAVLIPEQQAELEARQKLDQARQDYGETELDVTAYSGQNALIQTLAQKIVLLEREIADLRGG